MKLNQLRYLVSVIQNNLNITAAANKLHTSQPGVSKQIKLLEDELGFPLFERDGRQLVAVTPAGLQVVERALRILEETQNIRRLSTDLSGDATGSLIVGTTHTQARYVLPPVVRQFINKFPDIDLHLQQGSSDHLSDLASRDQTDLIIATGNHDMFANFVFLPLFDWYRCIVVPKNHPLAQTKTPSLKSIARFPLITYNFSFSGRSSLPAMFESANLKMRIALTATDTDIIKTYVRLGLGVGIMASIGYEATADHDLVLIPCQHLFTPHRSWVGFKRGRLLRGYMLEFLKLLAPHLTRKRVELAIRAASQVEVDAIFTDITIPTL
jgi:LysR family transcriptional regulator, cys regulon transcriptional activator